MGHDWFDELASLLRIQSISADPAHADDVMAAAEWCRAFVEEAGGRAELFDWKGAVLLDARFDASIGASAPTILVYGHFDVQPPDPLELWESEPFEPELRDGYLYARGTADDKGQLYMLLAAARELSQRGELQVNLRFLCDGEEETGGTAIVEFLAADKEPAAAAVIFDSGMIRRGLPAFAVATRGIIYLHLTLRTGERDLHSGIYGGAALNAPQTLARILASVSAVDGRLAEPLRAGIIAPTAEELAGWAELPSGADELAEQGARPADTRAAEEFYLRTFAEPAFDVNGIESGSARLQKTVLPVEAVANVSVRLAPGQNAETIVAAFEQLLFDATPAGAELTIERLASSDPGRVPPDAAAIRLALDAFERACGVRPALVRSGGSLPIVPALEQRGIPAIITGFALPDANIHSPNERLLAEYVALGIAAAREVFLAFAALPA